MADFAAHEWGTVLKLYQVWGGVSRNLAMKGELTGNGAHPVYHA
ncbi:MAG TPA: hypothetical protein VMI10_04635 [Terriglobales bacterium]|nr:hypothetical protein [Terriglobales bacterium]